MRKLALATSFWVLCSATLAVAQNRSTGTGKGQGAIVIHENALLYKDSQGEAAYGKLDMWEAVGGVQTWAKTVLSYQFEEADGRAHVFALGTSGVMYKGWIDSAHLSSYFTYECGCGMADAVCAPHMTARSGWKWNLCFTEARDRKLAELKNEPKTAVGVDSAVAKPSVEQRLQQLNDLLAKGLISKEEYDKKRSEILKDM